MIKNIVLDVDGIFFDDSKQNIQKLLNKKCDNIYKNSYGEIQNKIEFLKNGKIYVINIDKENSYE